MSKVAYEALFIELVYFAIGAFFTIHKALYRRPAGIIAYVRRHENRLCLLRPPHLAFISQQVAVKASRGSIEVGLSLPSLFLVLIIKSEQSEA